MKISTFILLLNLFCSASHAQEMKSNLNKELRANVGSICEETPDDNPCAGSEIFLTFLFDKEKVLVCEKTISSCGDESVYEIGIYGWQLLDSNEIRIAFSPDRIKGTYAENLFLELKNKKLVGRIEHLNGSVSEYTFDVKN